jgi:hypothetical protein
MTKQTALDFADLRYVEITCANCKAKLTVDGMSTKTRTPSSCCACGAPFDDISVRNPVEQFI